MQRRLAHIRRPDQRDLRRAFGPNHEGRAPAHPTFLGTLEFFGQLLDTPLDVTLEMVRSLVLGDHSEHLPQPLEALLRIARLAELRLRGFVLWGEVGGHDGVRLRRRAHDRLDRAWRARGSPCRRGGRRPARTRRTSRGWSSDDHPAWRGDSEQTPARWPRGPPGRAPC